MEVESTMVSLHRTSSIENEPRTLNIKQIQNAREAALFVVRTRSMEEALRIFTEGLKPVMNCEEEEVEEDEEGEGEEEMMGYNHEDFHSSSIEIKDIVSAPF